MSRSSRRRSTARWSGRRAARWASATIRCSCPTDMTRTFGEMPSEEKHGLPPHGRGLSHRARAFLKLAEACLAQTLVIADEAFGVYVHWPFCLSKCPYCDFNSHVRHAAIDEPRFLRAFAAEIAATAARVPRPHRVEHLPRRRHAVADAAGRPSARSSTPSASTGPSRPTSRSRSKPTRPASRRRAFAAIAPPASTASRSACRRSTTRR